MLDLKIVATSPEGYGPITIYPDNVHLSQDIDEPATLTFSTNYLAASMDTGELRDDSEASTTYYLGLNSQVDLYRNGSREFRGYIYSKTDKLENGLRHTEFACLDKMGKLKDTAASIDGDFYFSQITPPVVIDKGSPVNLVFLKGDITDHDTDDIETWSYAQNLFPMYPEFPSDAYLPTGAYNIVDMDLTAHTLTIADTGSNAGEFYAGLLLAIYGSTANNGVYSIASASTDGYLVTITVNEDIPQDYPTTAGALYSQFRTNFNTLGSSIADGTTTLDIQVSQDYAGFLPSGLVLIDDEVIAYEGYTQSESDSYWYLKNVKRGCLGTTGAGHTNGAEINQVILKKVHPSVPIILQGNTIDDPGTWQNLPTSLYDINAEEGWIFFNVNPRLIKNSDTTDNYGYLSFKMSYGYFDELSSDAVTFKSVLSNVLEADLEDGGADLGSDEYDIEVPHLRLTRVKNSDITKTVDFVDALRTELGIQASTTLQFINYWYDSSTDTFDVHSVMQKAQPDTVVSNAITIAKDVSLENYYSAVIVKYSDITDRNLLNSTMMYSPLIGDTAGDSTISAIESLSQEEDKGTGWDHEVIDDYADVDFGTEGETDFSKQKLRKERMLDSLPYTGWGCRYAADPGPDLPCLYAWFDVDNTGACVPYQLSAVNAIIDFRRVSYAANPAGVTIYGVNGLVPQTYNSDGSIDQAFDASGASLIPLSGAASYQVATNAGGYTLNDSLGAVQIQAQDVGAECEAICVVFDGMPGTKDGVRRAHIKELEAHGVGNRALIVKLREITSTDHIQDLIAPDTYHRLYGTGTNYELGKHRVKTIDVGVSSYNGAVSLGRLALLEAISSMSTKEYISLPPDKLPQIGYTVKVQEKANDIGQAMPNQLKANDFNGVLISRTYTANAGMETFNFMLQNLTSNLLAGGTSYLSTSVNYDMNILTTTASVDQFNGIS